MHAALHAYGNTSVVLLVYQHVDMTWRKAAKLKAKVLLFLKSGKRKISTSKSTMNISRENER